MRIAPEEFATASKEIVAMRAEKMLAKTPDGIVLLCILSIENQWDTLANCHLDVCTGAVAAGQIIDESTRERMLHSC